MPDEVLEVAEVDGAHRQGEGEPEHEDGLEQRRSRARGSSHGSTMLPAISRSDGEHAELDEERHAEAGDGGADEELAREPDLLDQVGVGEQRRPSPPVTPLARKFHGSRPHSRKKAKYVQAARVADGRVDLEEEPEDQREDHHLGQRVEQRPAPAEDRALVLAPQLPQGEVGEQLAVAAAARRQRSWTGGRPERGSQAGPLRYRPDADHLRLGPLPPELRQRRHAAAPAPRPGPATAGPRRRASSPASWTATDRRSTPGTTSTRPACPCAGSCRTPWIGWADQRNYDNPPVAEQLRGPPRRAPAPTSCTCTRSSRSAPAWWRWPDGAGAATVVTMHDFWWVCARQFLVDRDHRPCSLVVDAGDCAVRGRRPHLDATHRRARGDAARTGRPGPGAVAVGRPRCWRPTASPAAELAVDENGMDCPTPRLDGRTAAPADGRPGRAPLHRRAATR